MTSDAIVRQQRVPLLATLLLTQVPVLFPRVRPPLDPALRAERTMLLTEMKAAAQGDPRKTAPGATPSGEMPPGQTEVGHMARTGEYVTRRYPSGQHGANSAMELLARVEADFLKRPNDLQARCGFHTDVMIRTRDERPLTMELCFGCGLVRIGVPAAESSTGENRKPRRPATTGDQRGSPSFVYWMMVSPRALRGAVLAALPDIRLPQERDEERLRTSVDSCR